MFFEKLFDKSCHWFFLTICSLFFATAVKADVYLRPGENIFLGGQRVVCGDGGPIDNGGQRSFRCEAVDPSYTSLESYLRLTVQYADGRREANSIAQLHFRSDCDALAFQLTQRCGFGGSCSIQYCEADNSSYTSLATTMYNIIADRFGRFSVRAVDHFNYMQDCRNTL